MDSRLKRSAGAGRESRASQNAERSSADDKLASTAARRKMFREEFTQESLPKVPDDPNWHYCWLSTTNTYDTIHKRMRLGYQAAMADDLPGYEHLRVKSGEQTGFIAINEMVLYKLPMEVFQDYMLEVHHYQPIEESEKIRSQQEQLLNARDSSGRNLVREEGDGYEGMIDESKVRLPVFE